jgi:translation initiation factor 2 gamma subunit (eIF-2gamma)
MKMPEETCNQPQTIEELVLGILADESQIVRCLRIFFCKTLQEISCEKYMTPERKVKLASDLINAAAQKEAALAAVLEAISKIIDEEPLEWITLVPGASYQVTSSSAAITGVAFDAKTDAGVTGGTISAIADGDNVNTVSIIQEIPDNYFLDLNAAYPPNLVTLQNTGTVTVYIRNVVAGGG